MRELKFRAYHKKRKRMYEVLHLHMESELWATCKGYDVIEQKDIHIRVQPEDIVVMQYIGLNDKNDKDIYEGDIVAVREFYETPEMTNTTYINWEVVFKHGCFYLENNTNKSETDSSTLHHEYFANDGDFEVVGNIYENPELNQTA